MYKTRYFYYFPSNLYKHFHFYKAVKDVCSKSDINLELITTVRVKDYLKIKREIKKHKQIKCHLFITFKKNIALFCYLFFVILLSRKTVIHFKKKSPGKLSVLKKILPNRVFFITDLEGDVISEREFLLTVAQNKTELDSNDKLKLNKLISKEGLYLNLFDYVFVYNTHFKAQLVDRHDTLSTEIKVSHLMSFKKNSLFFDKKLKEEYRRKLGWKNNPIIVYIGNIYYSWQNISKTIRLYKRIKNEVNYNAKLLLLINESDHPKALEFIKMHGLEEEDYLLTSVDYNDIKGYLNASDIGIVLRDFHPMNQVVTSGKLLDYLGCGLPVITTSVLLNFSDCSIIEKNGLILEDLNIENISTNKIKNILEFNNDIRKELSIWSNNNISLDSMSAEYVNLLKKIGE